MAATEQIVRIQLGGQELRLTAQPDEVPHIERAARKVTEAIGKIQERYTAGVSPVKVATMAAFQFAFELSMADEMLEDAERLHEELKREKEAVQRLEALLARVDDALA